MVFFCSLRTFPETKLRITLRFCFLCRLSSTRCICFILHFFVCLQVCTICIHHLVFCFYCFVQLVESCFLFCDFIIQKQLPNLYVHFPTKKCFFHVFYKYFYLSRLFQINSHCLPVFTWSIMQDSIFYPHIYLAV